jgi:cytochrome oxidase Cu insertion factor (SCO1/SenC/PrrC family)
LTGGEAERVWRAAGVYVARVKSGSGYVVYHDVLFLLVVDGTARGYVAGLPDPPLSCSASRPVLKNR